MRTKDGFLLSVAFFVVSVSQAADSRSPDSLNNSQDSTYEKNQNGTKHAPMIKEKHNPVLEVLKIVGGGLLILSGTAATILADSPECDDESPVMGPCVEGTPHPTRAKIFGASLIIGGGGLVIWGVADLTQNIMNDN